MEVSGKRRSARGVALQPAAAGTCVIGVDATGRVRDWTKAAETVFGHSHERAIGLPIEQLAPFVSAASAEREGWCRRVDGSVFRGLVGTLIRDESTRVANDVAHALVVTDITSRYVQEQAQTRAQAAAQQHSEHKLTAILEAMSDGVMTVDSNGLVSSLNPAALRLLGAAQRPLLRAPWHSVLGLPAGALPERATFEATGRRSDGSTYTLECRVRTLDHDNARESVVLLQDVTQQRLLEHQVLDASEQLKRQIGQDLHDGLGQLLTGTAFLTKGLQHSLGSEHQLQTQRIVELINLAIARVRSLARGLSPIHVDAQSLLDVLRHAVEEASELLGVTCELMQRDFVDTAQPAAIAQLCLITREAITNAVRHGQASHIVVCLARQGDLSVLSIEDNGIGIGELVEGLGVRSMRYRAKIIGGELEVTRTATGTAVRCLWPDI